jgi:hypothetical protein
LSYKDLRQEIETLQAQLTPPIVEHAVRTLMRQGEDVGGGVNVHRLVKHLLGEPQMRDVEAVWAYNQLKPVFRQAFEQIPAFYYFEGD